jgi:hypothetical protein
MDGKVLLHSFVVKTSVWKILGSHSCGYEEFCLLGYNERWLTFNQRFKGTCCPHLEVQRIIQALIATCFHAGFLLGL